jgi:peroxiredoxin
LSARQLVSFEATLRAVDKALWPSRIRPLVEQRKLIAELEDKLMSEVERLYGAGKVERLRQIELQAQGSRILVRPEIEAFLRLDAKQRKKLSDLFAENDRLAALAVTKPPVDPHKLEAFKDAKAAEPDNARAVLTAAQAERIRKAMGPPIDTSKLKRIYPFAPELIDSGYWSTSERKTLESLRGKVVLVHFYAFQCHNCVANFGHYKRWDETLKKRGVQLIGIQTPETSAERDPEKVTSAANKEGFQFPVLIDVESKNWDAWGNTMWPTVYVIDKKGYIRFWYQGELNWQGATADQNIENLIDELVKE